MTDDNSKKKDFVRTVFSKDNPIVKISSKQEQIKTQEIIPPVKMKEIKKK